MIAVMTWSSINNLNYELLLDFIIVKGRVQKASKAKILYTLEVLAKIPN